MTSKLNTKPLMDGSIVSYPDRGPWGKSSWRGNCSGHLYVDLFNQLKPNYFIDPMMGSGTSIEVANEMGIRALGLDLARGFNALRDSILGASNGEPADLVCSHPPYGPCVLYSSEVWGKEAHPDDLSHAIDYEDFVSKMELVLLNQRAATRQGGHYGMLIGDYRKNGEYFSYQAEMIARMPKSELAGVIIKAQHNTVSGRKSYALKYPRILHEYLVIWKRSERFTSFLSLLAQSVVRQHQRLTSTWSNIVHHALIELGGKASLPELYSAVEKHANDKLKSNQNWKAKVRQTLQINPHRFNGEGDGVWALAAAA